jgi:hypothetical protein
MATLDICRRCISGPQNQTGAGTRFDMLNLKRW